MKRIESSLVNNLEQVSDEWEDMHTRTKSILLKKSNVSKRYNRSTLPEIKNNIATSKMTKLLHNISNDRLLDAEDIEVVFSNGRASNVPFVKPMRPISKEGSEVFFSPTDTIEEKKDGAMAFQYIADGKVAYVNRNGVSKTRIYPDLIEETKKIKTDGLTITQGEVFALNGGTDTFETFLKRDLLKDQNKIDERVPQIPLHYEPFDIVMKDGKWLATVPLSERRKILKDLIPKDLKRIKPMKVSNNPKKFVAKMRKDKTVEGVVSKESNSLYRSNKNNDWEKIKFVKEADTMIMGYNPGQGKRKEIGALQVGVFDHTKNKMIEVANVGTGFTNEELLDIKKRVDNGEKLFAKVEYLKVGTQGRLRMPSFKGLREDITKKETHL